MKSKDFARLAPLIILAALSVLVCISFVYEAIPFGIIVISCILSLVFIGIGVGMFIAPDEWEDWYRTTRGL
jgi:hypothetical protein